MIALVGLLAAACGGGDDDSSPPTSRRPESTTTVSTPTTLSAEAEVEQAYTAYKDMRRRLLQAPDPADPEITTRATGPAHDRLVDSLTTLRARNEAVRFGPDYDHSVTSVDISGDSAVLRECFVDDADVIDASTGEPVRPADVVTVLNRITLRAGQGGWRVSEIVQEAGWEGVTSCAG